MKKVLKNSLYFLCIALFILGCTKPKSLLERTKNFQVSECKQDCGVDSMGVRLNKIRNGDLYVRLGHIVNCSWKQGYLRDMIYDSDTLVLELDRPHDIDTVRIDSTKNNVFYEIETSYTLADCDCFFFFEFTVEDFETTPKSIRILDNFKKGKYWDERDIIEEVEDVEEEF
ncbi:hypothetical protein [Aquimarina litoralis]|uniref:hypothetical protein n=1 Tax=Aquimarina litoralis TaxID=584605 RepID=UPI001C5864D1|nr:hypothetical protein [Aquimarina litoralis]MBW1295023.1 hypothetical protein [Aquimarina litoralis]